MNNLFKKKGIWLSLLTTILLLISFITMSVSAIIVPIEHTGGKGGKEYGYVSGGLSVMKGGALVYLMDEGGGLHSYVTYVNNNLAPPASPGVLVNKYGVHCTQVCLSLSSKFFGPTFSLTGANIEPKIDSYMATIDLTTGYSGADKIITNLLGLPESVCVEATEKNWHIVIETVFWCYDMNRSPEDATGIFFGTLQQCFDESAQLRDSRTLSGAIFHTIAENLTYTEPFAGINNGIVNDTFHTDITGNGYAIGHYNCGEGDILVTKHYYINGGTFQRCTKSFASAEREYTIQHEPPYYVKAWRTADKIHPDVTPDTPYETVQGTGNTITSGGGPTTIPVDTMKKTKMINIKLVAENDPPPPPPPEEDVLMAHELNLPHSSVHYGKSWNRGEELGYGEDEGFFSEASLNIEDVVAAWIAEKNSFNCTFSYYPTAHSTSTTSSTLYKYRYLAPTDGVRNTTKRYDKWVLVQDVKGALSDFETSSELHSVIDFGGNSPTVPSSSSFKHWSDSFFKGSITYDWCPKDSKHGLISQHNDGNTDLNRVDVMPDYAPNTTRMIWKDDLVPSLDLKDGAPPSYVTAVLGFPEPGLIGHITSPKGMVDEGYEQYLNELTDSYYWGIKFTGEFQEDELWKDCSPSVEGSPHAGDHYDCGGCVSSQNNGINDSCPGDHCPGPGTQGKHVHNRQWSGWKWEDYEMAISSASFVSKAWKFRVQETDLGKPANAGDHHQTSATGMFGYHGFKNMCFFTQTSNYRYYPNVKYYYYNQDTQWYDTEKVSMSPVYMLGEIARNMQIPVAHAYKVTGWSPKGTTTLPNALTGASSMKGYETSNGTVAMGSTFEIAEDPSFKYSIVFETVGYYMDDLAGRMGEWGNGWDKDAVLASHDSFVANFEAFIDSEIILKFEDVNHASTGSYANDIYHLQTAQSAPTYSFSDTDVEFDWINGAGDTRGSSFNAAFHSADSDYGTFDLHNVLDSIFVNSSDGTGEITRDNAGFINNSGTIKGGARSNLFAEDTYGRLNWYDEEVPKLHVCSFVTTITYYPLIADDKVDYGTLGQYAQQVQNGGKAVKAKFYHRVFLNDGEDEITSGNPTFPITMEGYTFDVPKTLAMDEIKGTDFLVSNSTTGNALKK